MAEGTDSDEPTISPKMEDYLKAIYRLQQDQEWVTTSALAEALEVTPPTSTSMAQTLESHGLVDRKPYEGVRLTEEGRVVALEVIRHHRLLELFLTEHLEYDWAEVHEEADRLEHHISERLEAEIAGLLGDPGRDPHGAPIPRASLEPVEEGDDTVLAQCQAGDRVRITQVPDRDPEELAYLSDVGITPSSVVTVTDSPPIGLVTVELEADGTEVTLPADIAAIVGVEVLAS